MEDNAALLVVVDGANVVDCLLKSGHDSVTVLRRDAVRHSPTDPLSTPESSRRSSIDACSHARVASVPGVRVESAPGSGDDHMVDLVARSPGRRRLVVTADRELRRRVTELGAEVTGPRAVRP
ncbi:NTP pyrophosphohydrolase [Streptomyces galbus]|uniref:NTP pyrophosphohydrolase n=1 Tax=Streptomyces galbus TaxID=33898 RepID=UPI003EBA40F2